MQCLSEFRVWCSKHTKWTAFCNQLNFEKISGLLCMKLLGFLPFWSTFLRDLLFLSAFSIRIRKPGSGAGGGGRAKAPRKKERKKEKLGWWTIDQTRLRRKIFLLRKHGCCCCGMECVVQGIIEAKVWCNPKPSLPSSAFYLLPLFLLFFFFLFSFFFPCSFAASVSWLILVDVWAWMMRRGEAGAIDHVGPPVSAVGLVLYRGMHSFVISHSPSSPALLVLCGTLSCSCALEWVNDWLWNVCLIPCFSCCFGCLQNPLVMFVPVFFICESL